MHVDGFFCGPLNFDSKLLRLTQHGMDFDNPHLCVSLPPCRQQDWWSDCCSGLHLSGDSPPE